MLWIVTAIRRENIPIKFTVAEPGEVPYGSLSTPQQDTTLPCFHTNHPVGMGTEIQYDRGVLRGNPQFPTPYY